MSTLHSTPLYMHCSRSAHIPFSLSVPATSHRVRRNSFSGQKSDAVFASVKTATDDIRNALLCMLKKRCMKWSGVNVAVVGLVLSLLWIYLRLMRCCWYGNIAVWLCFNALMFLVPFQIRARVRSLVRRAVVLLDRTGTLKHRWAICRPAKTTKKTKKASRMVWKTSRIMLKTSRIMLKRICLMMYLIRMKTMTICATLVIWTGLRIRLHRNRTTILVNRFNSFLQLCFWCFYRLCFSS